MPTSPKIVGLIAGAGELPLAFAQNAKEKGLGLYTAAIRGAASARLNKLSDKIEWLSVGQLNRLITFFRQSHVRQAVLHGKVEHSALLKNPRLDLRALSLLFRVKERSGESLLKAVADELSRHGTKILDSRFLMKDFLAPTRLAQGSIKPGDQKSIRMGFQKAKALARLAVGQSVVVKKNAVVAVEGMEGTDETIRRAGRWAGPGTILVKVSSPQQDWRFDVPTIGPRTLQALAKAKAAGIAVEAGRVFILDREKIFSFAKKNHLFVTTVS